MTTLDAVILAAMGVTALYLWYSTSQELYYEWDWSVIPEYLVFQEETGDWRANILFHGIFATLRLTVWATLIALAAGIMGAFFRTSQSLFLRLIGTSFVALIRNIPPLIFIFVVYFFLSSQITPLLGITNWAAGLEGDSKLFVELLFGPTALIENFLAGLLVLGFFEAAYFTEIIRAGLQSVEKGQWEAARSIGLSRHKVMRYVIMPQAIQRTIPPLAGELISLVKNSSMVSLISVQDLTYSGSQVANSTRKVFEIWIFIAVVYFVICFLLSLGSRWLESHMGRGIRR